jgi:predicted lipid-binding transport protein (Tim44 family)
MILIGLLIASICILIAVIGFVIRWAAPKFDPDDERF